jgi:putative aldouronate transport system substrate-binding protein
MSKKVIKVFVILLALAMLTTVFAGCGKQEATDTGTQTEKTDTPSSDSGSTDSGSQQEEKLEPIDFTIWTGGADPGDFGEEDACHKYIREELGVNIIKQYTAGNADEQLNIMLAGGDYPDALTMKYAPVLDNYITGGHIVDLTEYLKKYTPDLFADMEKMAATYQLASLPGKYFWVPSGFGYSEDYPMIEPMLGFRYDVWKMIGKPKPKDLEEFYVMAKQMQDAYPETEDGKKTWAFSGWFKDWGVWAIYAMQRYGGQHLWVGSADAYNNWLHTYSIDSDEWMYAMRYLNRAYREGYGDPEAATMDHALYCEKLAAGQILINYYAGSWLDGVANAARAAAGHPEQKLVPYAFMKYPNYEGEPITGQYFPTPAGGGLFFTKNCKDPEEVFKRLSWLATEDGRVFQGMGLEGVHWDYDENGMRKPKDEIIQQYKTDNLFADKTGVGAYSFFAGMLGGFDSTGDAYTMDCNQYVTRLNEDEVDKEYKADFNIPDEFTVELYNAKYGLCRDDVLINIEGFEEGSDLRQAEITMENLQTEYVAKLYMAKTDEEFDRLVEEWRKKAEAVNYKAVIEETNKKITKFWEDFNKTAGN